MSTLLGDARVRIRPDLSGFKSEAESGISKTLKGIGGLASKAVLGVSGVATLAAGIGIKTAAGMETARIGFTTMLGSAQKADKFLRNLSKFAATTPFEFPELQTAASSLVSAGVAADDVIPIMKSLGNATAGMGTGSEGIQRATVALQQMNAAGRITGEDLNQLRDAGIPVYDLLAKATGKSKKEVAALAQAGKLGSKELGQMMAALKSGAGLERFAGLMDKQSASLSGLWSTLQDTFSQGMATAITPSIPLIKKGLGGAITLTSALMPKLASGLKVATTTITAFATAVHDSFAGSVRDTTGLSQGMALVAIKIGYLARTAGPFLRTVFDVIRGGAKDTSGMNDKVALLAISIGAKLRKAVTVFNEIKDAAGRLFAKVKSFDFSPFTDAFKSLDGASVGASFSKIGDSVGKLMPLVTQFADAVPALGPTVSSVSDILGFMGDHVDTLGKAMPFLIAGFVAFKAAQAANNVVGKDSLVGFGLQIGTTLALAASNRTLSRSLAGTTLSTAAATTAENVSTVSRIRSALATVASTVAQKAAAAAARVFAAGQWLVNAALSANPIGLVVLALAALVAGLVYAYQHSDTFRRIVDGAFHGIATACSFMWNSVVKPVLAALAAAFLDVAGTIVNAAASAFGWIPGLGPKLKSAAKKFDQFKRDVNASLNGISDKQLHVGVDFKTGGSVALSGVQNKINAGGAGPDPTKRATGGPIFGPGTGTSDSIPALLSNGEHVITAKEVQAAGGHGAITAWRKGLRKFATGGPVLTASTPSASAIRQATESGFLSFAASRASQLVSSMMGPAAGAGVQRWLPVVLQALRMTGQSVTLANTLLRRMEQESGGNPRAINLTDSNAAAGDPSRGLMQTIGSTFNAYRMPGLSSNIYDPLSNIVASIRYAVSRYGSLASAYNRSGGYDSGGIAQGVGFMPKATLRPERVLSPSQTKAFEEWMRGSHNAQQAPIAPAPLIGGDLILQTKGESVRDDLGEVSFQLRRIARGGVHAHA